MVFKLKYETIIWAADILGLLTVLMIHIILLILCAT